MNKNATIADLDQLTRDSFARVSNKMIWASKKPLEYGTGEKLSHTEIQFIHLIVKDDALSVTLVAKQLGITKSAVSQLAGSLVKKGYLTTVASPSHGKTRLLKPTKKALIASSGLDAYHMKLSRHLSGVTKAELLAHLKVSARIEDFLAEIYPEK